MSTVSRRPRRWGATLVILMMGLAGCGQTPGAVGAKVPTPTKQTAVAVQPAAPAAVAAVAGRLEIQVGGLGGYTLQATTAQVSKLRVTLSGGALTAPVVKEVTAGQLSGGKGTVAFEAVPHGLVTVKIEALDAAGANLGARETSTEVTGGQTAVVAVTLKLNATHVASQNGNLAVDLTLENGDVVVDPIASPSPRPSSPVLSPAPSASPGAVRLLGDVTESWYADGKMAVKGTVRNDAAVAKVVTVNVAFMSKVIFGTKVRENVTVTLGSVAAGASVKFSAVSTQKVATVFSDGTAVVTVTAP